MKCVKFNEHMPIDNEKFVVIPDGSVLERIPPKLPFGMDDEVFSNRDGEYISSGPPYRYNDYLQYILNLSGIDEYLFGIMKKEEDVDIIEEEYPPCNVCGVQWTIIPPENEWDVESASLHHKKDCEYAKKRMQERDGK